MSKIKIGIVDDYELLRISVSNTLNDEADIEVILQAGNGKELLDLLEHLQPDLLLMDIRMPIMDGIEASKKVKTLYPNIKIIAFSQYDLETTIVEMQIIGVKSFIGKEDGSKELLKAIRTVNDGGSYMTDRSTEIVKKYLSQLPKYLAAIPTITSEQEKRLIRMITEGLTSKEIGSIINKSHRTVEDMRQKIYLKFNVKSKEQLIALVAKWNLE